MKLSLAIAGLLVAYASGPAFCGTIGLDAVIDPFTGVAPTAPDYTVAGSIAGSNIESFDGQFVFDIEANTGAGQVEAVVFFTDVQSSLHLSIYTGDVSGVYLAGVNFQQADGAAPSAFWAAGLPADGELMSNVRNLFTFDLGGSSTYSLIPQAGFSAGSTYREISLLFAFDNAGDRIQLDAVAVGIQAVPLPPALWSGLGVLAAAGAISLSRRLRSGSPNLLSGRVERT